MAVALFLAILALMGIYTLMVLRHPAGLIPLFIALFGALSLA